MTPIERLAEWNIIQWLGIDRHIALIQYLQFHGQVVRTNNIKPYLSIVRLGTNIFMEITKK